MDIFNIDWFYRYRFDLFFFSLISILFGSVFFPIDWFEENLLPIFFLGNLLSGILLISKNKNMLLFFSILFFIVLSLFVRKIIVGSEGDFFEAVRVFTFFIFYASVTLDLIRQVWSAPIITKNVIIGLMCGYIALGLVFFFIFITINSYVPDSFNGINAETNSERRVDDILYFSYITLLTIGYGDITPNSLIAHKISILTGLAGQFYLVILTAIIVGKYINQTANQKRIK